MSRNNKGARLNKSAKEASQRRVSGTGGAAKTTPKHGKKRAWWQTFGDYAAFIKGGKKGDRGEKKSGDSWNISPELTAVPA